MRLAVLAVLLLFFGAAASPAVRAAEAARQATLPNGLRVVVVPDHLAPVVSTQLAYLVGGNDSPPGFPGTAHALEHMMFRGAEGLDRDQLSELGAQLGGNFNASTSQTVTQYTFTVPASDLPVVLRIEAGRMRGAFIREDDWRQERGAIEQEVSRDLSNPGFVQLIEMQAALFAGSPYENTALGTRPSFEKTDATLLRRFYETWYAPNNAVLVIAGDVDPDVAIRQATEAFAGVPRATVPEHAAVTLPPLVPRTLDLPTSAPVGTVSLVLRMPGYKSADFFAADVLGDVLGSERGALYALSTSGKVLSAGFSFSAYPDVGMAVASADFPAGGDPAPVLAELKRVLADAAAGDIPPDLVEAAKQAEVAQLAFSADSISGLARLWARAVVQQGVVSPDDLLRGYGAVTVDDVKRMAGTLLDTAQAVTIIETPGARRAPGSTASFGGAETFGAAPDHAVALPPWAVAALAAMPDTDTSSPPIVSVLPNGLRLIVQTEHVTPTVSVFGRVREQAELQEPPGQEGVSILTARLFGFGTAQKDRLAYRKAVDDIAAVASAGSSFGLKVLAPRFREGMALLAENQLQPAFPDDAFTVVRAQLSQALAGLLQSPDFRVRRARDAALTPEGDPTRRQPTPATLAALTPADVRAYYKRAFRPDRTTIVVVGDVTVEEAQKVVADTFGAWAVDGATPDIELSPVAGNAPATIRVPDPGSVQDSISLSQTLDVPVSSPDRYRLLLGNTVLGNGFSSRLYQDLRVRTGYVYSVSSFPDWSRTRARFQVAFGADPDKAEAAVALVVRNLRAMQETPVSEAELVRAKAQIVRQLAMGSASVPAIAGGYLRLIDLDLPLDTARLAPARYRAITAADIQAAFAAYVRPNDLVQVVKGPPPADPGKVPAQ